MAKATVQKAKDIRWFRAPEITLMRMGREVARYRGTVGKLDLPAGRIELTRAEASVGGAGLTAGRLSVDLPRTRLVAEDGVRLDEAGVTLEGQRASALPSLSRLRFHGAVRLRAKTREAADALLGSRLA